MWYDINRTLSYNALFNFVIGMRGVGKTYAFKRWAIRDFIKTGSQFAYVRRYKTEIKAERLRKFFKDIAPEFPDHEFEVKGNVFYIDKKVAGQAFPLSTSKIEKSVPFPEINKICFDEFILDKGSYHYLADEVTNFLELYSTIARLRDNVTVFFLSNAITVTNPYFEYFNVKLPYGGKTIARTGNEIIVEVIREAEYSAAAKKTRFGSLIDGTEYGAYNIDNEFYRDNRNFVAKKTPGSEYYFTIRYNGVDFGIWADYKEGLLTVSRDVDPSSLRVYALTNDDHRPNALLVAGPRAIGLQTLRNMYNLGAVRFESIGVKNSFMPAIKLLGRR